jgi:hypothetical protein
MLRSALSALASKRRIPAAAYGVVVELCRWRFNSVAGREVESGESG